MEAPFACFPRPPRSLKKGGKKERKRTTNMEHLSREVAKIRQKRLGLDNSILIYFRSWILIQSSGSTSNSNTLSYGSPRESSIGASTDKVVDLLWMNEVFASYFILYSDLKNDHENNLFALKDSFADFPSCLRGLSFLGTLSVDRPR
ncbi:hypothetical protein ACMFMG_010614 [Clarireedia jacksonii]